MTFQACLHLGIICLGAVSASATATETEPAAAFCTSDRIAPRVLSDYCENTFHKVFVLRQENGTIGGYLLQPAIRDAPVSYLDCRGDFLVSLHVFGSEEEKAKANSIIEPLNKSFPLMDLLSCPAAD